MGVPNYREMRELAQEIDAPKSCKAVRPEGTPCHSLFSSAWLIFCAQHRPWSHLARLPFRPGTPPLQLQREVFRGP